MTVTPTPGALKKFRRAPWRFQSTIGMASARDSEKFLSTILDTHSQIDTATITIDEIVFNAKRLDAICPAGSTLTHDSSIAAESAEELRTLLVAAFWDAPDFLCIPSPKPFVFYADHHNLVTFYANTKSHLNHVVEPLVSNGYGIVKDWQREL